MRIGDHSLRSPWPVLLLCVGSLSGAALLVASIIVGGPAQRASAHIMLTNPPPKDPRDEEQPIYDPGDEGIGEGGCDDEAAGGGSCADDDEGSCKTNPSSETVLVTTGRKAVSFTDVAVQLSTGVHTITHQYVSDDEYRSSPVAGKKWTISPYKFLSVGLGEQVVTLQGRTRGKTKFVNNNPFLRWYKVGGGLQYISQGPDGWSLVTPGERELVFHRTGDFDRLIKEDRNLRTGQVHTYTWILVGQAPNEVPRLDRLDLNGSDVDSEAWLEFTYYTTGLLKGIDVYHRGSPGTIAEQVEYKYKLFAGDGHADLGPNYDGSNPDPLSGYGVLTMVTNTERPGASDEKVSIQQFRYHSEDNNGPGGTSPFTWQGENAQIKMEIRPQQLEWAYAQYVDAGGQWTFKDYADWLLGRGDGDTISSGSPVKVYELASRIIEAYEGPQLPHEARIKRQFLQASCGCAGSGQNVRVEYDYFSYGATESTTSVAEDYFDGQSWTPRRTTYFDTEVLGGLAGDTPYLVTKASIGPAGDPRELVTHYEFDSQGRLRMVMTPAARLSYTPGDASNPPDYSADDGSGLVRVFDYDVNGREILSQVRDGAPDLGPTNDAGCSDCTLTDVTIWDASHPHLVSLHVRYRKASSDPDDAERTEFFYQFFSDDDIKSIEKRVESELEPENGQGGTYSSYEHFDVDGRNDRSVAADGTETHRTFDPDSGYLTQTTQDALGLAYTTTYDYDDQGRLQQVTTPNGTSTYTVRRMEPLPDDPGGMSYSATVTLPHIIDAAAGEYAGPARVTWTDAAGNALWTSTYSLVQGLAYDTDPDSFMVPEHLDTELTRERTLYNIAGQTTSRQVWDRLSARFGSENYHETRFEYDVLGRLQHTINPNDTVAENLYDFADRVIEEKVGVWFDDAPTEMRTIARSFFDHEAGPQQGEGNGNVTLVRQVVDDDPQNDRDTEFTYDFRDRRISTKSPDAPHEVVAYDNLGRVIKRAMYGPGDPPGDPDIVQDRVRYEEIDYSQRGRVYRRAQAIDPSNLSLGFLESHTWHDEVGRAVGSWAPGGPATKITYDRLGRAVTTYTTDRRDDPDPGDPLNYIAVFESGQANVDGDVVFEQRENRYINSGPHMGMLDLSTTHVRTHDAGDDKVGDLADFVAQVGSDDAKLVISTYSGSFYDDADRLIRSVYYGTNQTTGFNYGGPEPDINQANPPDWTNPQDGLVNASTYNDRGLIDTTTDPAGQVARFEYDDANRQIAIVENYQSGNPPVIAWSGTDERWIVTSGLLDDESNRVTSTVYDGLGNTIIRTAHLPSGVATDQMTQYMYGVDMTTGTDDPLVSDLVSNDLLDRIIYPDELGQGAATLEQRTVHFAYNRQGELITMEDQNDTRHVYTRDNLGRVTSDTASKEDAASPIDDTHNAITWQYHDDTGLPSLVSTKSAQPIVVVNEVMFEYDAYWQIEDLYQDHDGPVEVDGSGQPLGNTVRITHAYDRQSAAQADGNYTRLQSITYPDGRVIQYDYDTAGSSSSCINRIVSLVDATDLINIQPIASYEYVGLSRAAVVDLDDPAVDVQLDRTATHDGRRQWSTYTDTPGSYAGFDQFGRIARQMWVDGDFAKDGPNPPDHDPVIPPIVELTYTYDQASNRTTAYNENWTLTQWKNRDFVYEYDGLDRLEEARRGHADTEQWAPGNLGYTASQSWSLDVMGNWETLITDSNADAVYDSQYDEDEVRVANGVNELTSREIDAGGPLTLTYDAVGNLHTHPFGSGPGDEFTYTHDAWNRLVRVSKDGVNRGEYQYNGLNWRTSKLADTDLNNTLDQERVMYYSSGWQLVEEHVDDGYLPGSPSIDRHVQYVWGPRYIDDIILHRENNNPAAGNAYDKTYYHLTDAQFSTVAIVDDNGATLIERVSYDAYGNARHHRASDLDGDGQVVGLDYLIMLAYWQQFGPGDLNRDGIVNFSDQSILFLDWGPALPPGELSTRPPVSPPHIATDNQIGYAGYVFNAETQPFPHYTVRNRSYDPLLGRWYERDPAGYVDGMNLYQYTSGSPSTHEDPHGLMPPKYKGQAEFKCCKGDPGAGDAAPPMLTVELRVNLLMPMRPRILRSNFRELNFIYRQCCIRTQVVGGFNEWPQVKIQANLGPEEKLEVYEKPGKPTKEEKALMKNNDPSKVNAYFLIIEQKEDAGASYPYKEFDTPPAPAFVVDIHGDWRTLAHELGHVLLDTVDHGTGLMWQTPSRSAHLSAEQCRMMRQHSLVRPAPSP